MDELRDDAGVHHQLDSLIGSERQEMKGPADVRQDALVVVVNQLAEDGQDLADDRQTGRRIVAAAKVRQRPRHAVQKIDLLN